MTNNRYTDEALHERATRPGALPGPKAEFQILTQVPLEVRSDIVGEAMTMQNYLGGRYSDCMRRAVNTWTRSGEFPFRARAAAHREAENKANEGNLGRRIILPMN